MPDLNEKQKRIVLAAESSSWGRGGIAVVVVPLISSTTTSKGLQVYAELDKSKYLTKIKITDEEMERVNINRRAFHGEWNYTICP